MLFRENMQQKMRMHSRKPAEEDAKLQEQLLWTLFDQVRSPKHINICSLAHVNSARCTQPAAMFALNRLS